MRCTIPLGLAGLSLIAVPALAQNRTVSGRGNGSLNMPNTAAIPLYHVKFDQSGRTLTLVFVGKNAALPFTLEGRVTGNAYGNDLPVEITGGLRDSETRGSGRIVLSGNNLASVNLNGTGKKGAFNLAFSGGGGGGGEDWAGGGTGARPINMSTIGSGTYEWSGRRDNLSEMRIRLYDDGQAELSFSGERNVSGRGTWRRGIGGRADITLNEWNGRRTAGNAAVTYRGNEIERVGVNVPQQNSRVEFFPGRYDSGGGGGMTPAAFVQRCQTELDGKLRRELGATNVWYPSGRALAVNPQVTNVQGETRVSLPRGPQRSFNYLCSFLTQEGGRLTAAEYTPADAGPGGGGGGAQPVNTSFVGTGTYREGGRLYQLNEASVRLRDNGEAELQFDGQRQTGGRGRWTPSGTYANITIQQWDGRTTSGSGNVVFSGNQPDQVNVTLANGRSITFRSRPQIQPR